MMKIFSSVLLLATSCSCVFGQAGALDPTFDGDGRLTAPMSAEEDEGFAIAVQTDGKIVVAGNARSGTDMDIVVARYLPNGTLDTSFSADGTVYADIGWDYATGIAVQADGRIVVCGWTSVGVTVEFLVLRYDPSGALDSTFDSDGVVVTSIGPNDDQAFELTIQPDGRIVVVGAMATSSGGPTDLALVRYDTDGSLDSTFDGDGVVTTALGPGPTSLAHAAVLQPDGKIIAGGWGGNDFGLARYEPDGDLDPGFGIGGMVTTQLGMTDLGYDLALQDDGKILLAGSTGAGVFSCAIVRYEPDGTPDASFGTGGSVVMAFGSTNNSIADGVIWLPDGTIVVSGYGYDPIPKFLLFRLTASGTLDTTFGTGGVTLTSFGSGDAVAFGSALQPDGRILLCGLSGTGSDADLAVARYNLVPDLTNGSVASIASTDLLRVFPDPVVERTILEYGLPSPARTVCALIDVQGRSVRTFFDAPRSAGRHQEVLDMADVAAGRYTITLWNALGSRSVQVVKQ